MWQIINSPRDNKKWGWRGSIRTYKQLKGNIQLCNMQTMTLEDPSLKW